MHHLIGDGDGQTPLDEDEAAELKPSWIATRGDLNRAELENIAAAGAWARRKSVSESEILDEIYLKRLHARMFDRVWKWAGRYRTSAKSLGVDAAQIQQSVAQLIGNTSYWIEHETFSRDEIAVRFHHQLVSIHPFPNGNGRHARLAADLLVESLGSKRFSWGAAGPDGSRARYIAALQAADNGDLEQLLIFARS